MLTWMVQLDELADSTQLLRYSVSGIEHYNQLLETIQSKQARNQLDSIIHPIFLQHFIREGNRSLEMIKIFEDM